jgi:hypothetical protein
LCQSSDAHAMRACMHVVVCAVPAGNGSPSSNRVQNAAGGEESEGGCDIRIGEWKGEE